MTNKERYDTLKSEHRCVCCAKPLPEDYAYSLVRCPECLDYQRAYWANYSKTAHKKRQPKSKRKNKLPDGVLTISQVLALAKENGVSYGKMVAIIEEGKA